MPCARRGVLVAASVVAIVCVGSVGCDRNPTVPSELEDQHRQILSRLADLERKIDRLASRPATVQRPLGPDPARAYNLPIEGSPVKGPPDAPITIVEFADYQCPFCARSEAVVQEVLKAYPTQARLVYKHFPLTANHPQALPAALAATAAQRQGKFWEMHAILFANQRALSTEQIEGYARQLGLDMARFRADMASDEVKAQVEADRRLARRAGVRGTPTLFVNGRLVQDRTVNGFRKLIDPMLTRALGPTPSPRRDG
jgi:protein-disulfide isomerase